MARIVPDLPPSEVESWNGSAAEARVYEALRDGLPDTMLVVFGVAWLGNPGHGRRRDGEADFVIIHPQTGILVIEVKGGGIERDPGSGHWYSWDRHGRRHEIRDPIAQARDSKYALIQKVKDLPGWERRWIPFGHAVIFADALAGQAYLGPDAPREILGFAGDLDQLGNWANAVQEYWLESERSRREESLSPADIERLADLLAPEVSIQTSLGARMGEESRQFRRLTQEQCRVLDFASKMRRASVSGGAGTGKTMLALEQATRLERQGFRTLLTCFNRSLGIHLRELTRDCTGLTAIHFHELCWDLAEQAGIDIPRRGAGNLPVGFFDQRLPEALAEAVEAQPDFKFDAIVVDEGQDIAEDWWLPLQLCLGDPDDGILWVFYDDNQRLFTSDVSLPPNLEPLALSRNVRNTREIHTVAARHYAGAGFESAGPVGQAVEYVVAPDGRTTRAAVSRVLHRLANTELVERSDVAVLTGRSLERSEVCEDRRIGAFECCSADRPVPGQVTFDTVRRFKGLEKPAVVICEFDSDPDEELLYVAVTRARSHLVVVGDEAIHQRVKGVEQGPD